MGINASYRRVTPEEFSGLQSYPAAAAAFFGLEQDLAEVNIKDQEALASLYAQWLAKKTDKRHFSLGKEWQALHFLLTGNADLTGKTLSSPVLDNVVLGGTPMQVEASYGFVRYLTPEEVMDVAECLRRISVEELKRRFDPGAFNAAEIYPNPSPGGWNETEILGLLATYPKLVEFFQEAAQAGDIVLLSFD
jgi:Domain of unknown function (DUF1877)